LHASRPAVSAARLTNPERAFERCFERRALDMPQRHEIVVREYQRSADLERVLEIATALPAWFTRSGICSMQADLRYQCGFVAEDANKEVVGFISFFVNQGKAEIGWIGIRPDRHRQGVGRSLLHRLLKELESTQVSELYVHTLGDTVDYEPYQRTRKFYRQMGFQDFKRIAHPENPECEEELILLLKLPV
jgi:ribosomal protein S18 acetylase RimI-like enzyme